MIARNKMWEELKQAKANIVCITHYTDKRRKLMRVYNVSIILFSSAGALSSYYNPIFAIIATSMIALTSILKSALPNLIQTEQELSELDRLLEFYNKYFSKLESIWYKCDKGIINEDEMIMSLFELKESECEKYTLLNRGIRGISKKEQQRINNKITEYINRVYFERN